MAKKKTPEQKKALREVELMRKENRQKQLKKKLYDEKEWYTARSLLGNQWANWFVMAGARP